MPRKPGCTVFIGNLDQKVNDRVLYEVMVQAGRIVDIHIPRDRETNRPKGYAFAEYETEESADYAVRLFSGVSLNNRMLKFAKSIAYVYSVDTQPGYFKNGPLLMESANTRFCVFTEAKGKMVSLHDKIAIWISVQDKPSHDLTSHTKPALDSPPKARSQPIQLKQAN